MTNSLGAWHRRHHAFTLIELIAVMVVLAVLAGIAIPKYFDYKDRTQSATLQNSLDSIRAGMQNFLDNTTLAGTAAFPSQAELTTIGSVMPEAFPKNPYSGLNTVQRISKADAQTRATSNTTQFGWNYYVDNASTPPVKIFFANCTNTTRADDGAGGFALANDL